MTDNHHGSMLELFVFETVQLLELLEQTILESEKNQAYSPQAINEIFRAMHTIKGSASMMFYENIASLAHTAEDLFHYLREAGPTGVNHSELSDLVLEALDFVRAEIAKLEKGREPDGDASLLRTKISQFLERLQDRDNGRGKMIDEVEGRGNDQSADSAQAFGKTYRALIQFEDGCQMENVRAYQVVYRLQEMTRVLQYVPGDIVENDHSADHIRQHGFQVWFSTERSYEEIHRLLSQTTYLQRLELSEADDQPETLQAGSDPGPGHSYARSQDTHPDQEGRERVAAASSHHNMISVAVNKLDRLMDLVGELVISEAMVTQNPDLKGLELDNFHKAAIQHRKIIDELQDIAMSIRMVPLSMTFNKMQRLVRDMSRRLEKEIELVIYGEETEVDKNIIEHISDPLMHLIRNAIDHGIEPAKERVQKGKSSIGKIILEAKNAGGDVLITVKDDGRGLNRSKIYRKAYQNGLTDRPESELTDKEIYSFIFLPGFSTKEQVTEFSGRGVGMDVVAKNIEGVGGTVSVDSTPDAGTAVTIKIPLTLAIIDGMNIRVGRSIYTIPTASIKESFKIHHHAVLADPNGHELIMIRGECYPVLRLYERFRVKTDITNLADGIIIMVEHEGKSVCLLADELMGQQQVVVKALPDYIRKFRTVKGLAGCTLLGDGSISLILDIASLIDL